MSDKSFKVKNGLVVPSLSTAGVVRTDSSGVISSSATLGISEGGTGQTSAQNARNALLPLQTGNEGYFLSTDQVNVSWAKVYNQLIKNADISVNPRGIVNFVGFTFSDDSGSDTTTITAGGVSTNGGSTITASSASVKPLIIKGSASQTANLQEWQNSSGTVITRVRPDGQIGVGSTLITGTNFFVNNTISTTNVVATIRGAVSQTANLQEWQDSAGTVKTGITSSGQLFTTQRMTIGLSGISSLGELVVSTADAARVGVVVAGVASQTTNLQEWQNSAGTILARVSSGGAVVTSGVGVFGSQSNTPNAQLYVLANSLVYPTFVAKAIASQTANLTEWQNSAGTVLAAIEPNGSFYGSSITAYGILTSNSSFRVNNAAAGTVAAIIKGAASQTSNLQEWQNSAGTILSKVDSSGIIYSPTAASGTNTTQVATTEFVSTAVNNLIDSAPGTLNTLNEIAAALNDDPNFYSTISTLTTALSSQDTYSLMGVF